MLGNKGLIKAVLMEIWKAGHIQVSERERESKVAEKFLEIIRTLGIASKTFSHRSAVNPVVDG